MPRTPTPPSFVPLSVGLVARAALVALVAACSDGITTPGGAPDAAPRPLVPSVASPDVVVMERTTDVAARDGVPAVHRTMREVLAGQVRVATGGRAAPARELAAAPVDVAHLPRPAVSMPARSATAMCSTLPTWTQTMWLPGGAGHRVEMRGEADGPASTLRIMRNDSLVATVERSWIRTPRSWQLARQVTTSADGRYRDVVTYEHRTASGAPIRNALPTALCVTPPGTSGTPRALASRSYTVAPAGALFAALAPGAAVSEYVGECTDDRFAEDPCYDKQLDVYKADGALSVTAAAAAVACFVPEPAQPPACAAALIAYAAAVANLKFAVMSLDNCRREQAAKKPCSCSAERSLSSGIDGPTVVSTAAADPLASFGTIADLEVQDDCDSWGGDLVPPDSPLPIDPAGGATDYDCKWEEWEISYDGGETWQYWGTFWTCYGSG